MALTIITFSDVLSMHDEPDVAWDLTIKVKRHLCLVFSATALENIVTKLEEFRRPRGPAGHLFNSRSLTVLSSEIKRGKYQFLRLAVTVGTLIEEWVRTFNLPMSF